MPRSLNAFARAGVAMSSRLLALAFALLLLPAPALASVKEKVAAMAPTALVYVVDDNCRNVRPP